MDKVCIATKSENMTAMDHYSAEFCLTVEGWENTPFGLRDVDDLNLLIQFGFLGGVGPNYTALKDGRAKIHFTMWFPRIKCLRSGEIILDRLGVQRGLDMHYKSIELMRERKIPTVKEIFYDIPDE